MHLRTQDTARNTTASLNRDPSIMLFQSASFRGPTKHSLHHFLRHTICQRKGGRSGPHRVRSHSTPRNCLWDPSVGKEVPDTISQPIAADLLASACSFPGLCGMHQQCVDLCGSPDALDPLLDSAMWAEGRAIRCAPHHGVNKHSKIRRSIA